ncbi:DUF2971 domain-containing protein [Bacillus badius]|uniref:DUF2971 domain-containing protein n=1 Tax=Bacillus badius TaxID=1455 RepID=UPI000596B551|nr:DUF2971 domain-containing protein [Bacillus badius]KIL74356.1 hypothetical protein SD78_1425 [Bacillus badius]
MTREKWIDEYVGLMYPENVKDMKMEDAMKLKQQNIPSSLYKYRDVNDNALSNFENDTVWFNNASKLNDPYDCFSTMDAKTYAEERMALVMLNTLPSLGEKHGIELSDEQIEQMKGKSFKEIFEFGLSFDEQFKDSPEKIREITKVVDNVFDKIHEEYLKERNERSQSGIFLTCFSKCNDSILMWSHYAKNHTGFCIEYDFTQPHIDPGLIRNLQPVIYTDNIFDMTPYIMQAVKSKSEYNNLWITYGALFKSNEWKYEKEWRMTFPLGKGSGFNSPLFKPKAIYLGSKITEEDKEKIMPIAQQKQISVFQMKMKNDEFKLVPEKIL